MLKKFWKSHSGATAIEYGLIAALIAVAVVSVLNTFSGKVQNTSTTAPEARLNGN